MKSLVSSSSFDLLKRSVWEHIPWGTLLDAHFNHSTKTENHFKPEHVLHNGNNYNSITAKNVNESLPTLLVSSCLLGAPVSYRGTCARCVHYKFNKGKHNLHSKFAQANDSNCKNNNNNNNKHASKNMLRWNHMPTPFTFFSDVVCDYLCEQNYIRCIPFCPEMQLLHLPSPRPPMKLMCKSNCCSYPESCISLKKQKARYCTSLVQLQNDCKSENSNKMNALLSWHHTQLNQLYCNDTIEEKLCNTERGTVQQVTTTKIASKRETQSTFDAQKMHLDMDAEWSCLLPVSLCEIDGIVCKARSPSCGVGDARLYRLDKESGNTMYKANHKSKTQMPYSECDGFFVQWLHHMYDLNYNTCDDNTTYPCTSSNTRRPPPPPIISELLMNNNIVNNGKWSSCKTFNNRNESGSNALLCFMDSVLKHYEHRTS